MPKKHTHQSASVFFDELPDTTEVPKAETAIIYCENGFGESAGEIAHGLVKDKEQYEVLSIIDDAKAGQDSGKVLGGEPNGIKIFRNLGTALAQSGRKPVHFIYGRTPVDGTLTNDERRVLLRAIEYKMNIACELHEFLNSDPEFVAAITKSNVVIQDVRKPQSKKFLSE